MRFNGITTNLIPTLTGIPQGSPLSPILYILYNSDLLEIPRRGRQLGLGFIDNILYGVQNKTAMANAIELEQLLAKSEQWRQRHGAQFEKSKYVLIHFTRTASSQMEASVTVGGITIRPSSEARYLGVIFDRKLKFRTHIEQTVAKGTKYALAIAGIAKSKWGPEFKKTPLHSSSTTTNRLCSNNLAQTRRHTNGTNYFTTKRILLSTRQNHEGNNGMFPHYRNRCHGTRDSSALTTMAPHSQNPADYHTNGNHGDQSSDP